MKKLRFFFVGILLMNLLLTAKEGHLVLIKNNFPIWTHPFRLHSLPPLDQTLLLSGIPIESSQQLTMLLEDYLS